MRIAVTGAHGFLGSHITRRLLADGHLVRALLSPWGDDSRLHGLASAALETRRVDLTRPASLVGCLADCEAVVHAAARVADWGREDGFTETNVRGTQALLSEAGASGCRRFVLISSVAVHRYTGYVNADARHAPLDGDVNAYARSKVAAEKLVRAWPSDWVIVRPGLWPYGEGDPGMQRIVAACKRGLIPLAGAGSSVVNTVWAGNLAHGVALATTVSAAAGNAFVIADDGAPTWRELFSEIARLSGGPEPRLRVPGWLLGAAAGPVEDLWSLVAPRVEPPITRYRAALMRRDMHFSINHARDVLGYEPLLDWRAGLARTLASMGVSS